MRLRQHKLKVLSLLFILLGFLSTSSHLFAQAALLLEQPYGFFGALNPTGHAAIYLEHVCADTPVHLRLCNPGETGVVVSRYQGMAGYDWVAIPLIPYLYSVDDPARVPERVDEESVTRLREHYREVALGTFGEILPPGGFFDGGWTQLVGASYDRRIYAFRFATTPAQDLDLITRLNGRPNKSHFNLLFNNCADFDRFVLNSYFPKVFGRTIFPDAGITTPKHIAFKLVKYSKRHPETQLTVLAIPQVPGYRRKSRSNHGIAESLVTTTYVVPIVVLNPYVAGGLLADYLIRGRYQLIPKNPVLVDPDHLEALIPSLPDAIPNAVPDSASPVLTQVTLHPENPVEPSSGVIPAVSIEFPLSVPVTSSSTLQPTHQQ